MSIRAGAWLGLAIVALAVGVVHHAAPSRAEAAPAAITPAADNARKLNLVSRLTMMSQHLTRSLCFNELRPHAQQPNEIEFAIELFRQTLDDLHQGAISKKSCPSPSLISSSR